MTDVAAVPPYADLPTLGETGERSGWGVFGDDDQVGTLNHITAETVRAAAESVRTGETFNLSLPLDIPDPALAGERDSYTHHLERTRSGGDDRLDSFYPQGSTQWDGLAHVRFREFGYYNGRDDNALDDGELGIDRLSEHGLLTRGLLLDAAGWSLATRGTAFEPDTRHPLTAADLDAIAAWQGATPAPGDVVMLHTGWLSWYVGLDRGGRERLAGSLHPGDDGLSTPGLDPSPDTAAWLWDHHIAAIAGDTPTVECLPVRPAEGFLHRRTLALLGMPIGEFWWLADLAAACRTAGRYELLLSATPWRLPRGVGSPVTPMAVL